MPLPGDAAQGFEKAAAGDQIQPRRRLVQQQGARVGDQRPRDQHAPRLPRGHLRQRLAREVGRFHQRQRLLRPLAHRRRDGMVLRQTLAGEKAGQNGLQARQRAVTDKRLVQIGRDDAEQSPQRKDVPAVPAEDGDLRLAVCPPGDNAAA